MLLYIVQKLVVSQSIALLKYPVLKVCQDFNKEGCGPGIISGYSYVGGLWALTQKEKFSDIMQ